MQTYQIPNSDLTVSRIAYGCMNLGGAWDDQPLTDANKKAAITAIATAYESGVNLFDHADIYMRGKSEQAFAEIWQAIPGIRDKIILQGKCGIRFADDPQKGMPGRYDFSYEHIIRSVEGSLERLQTDYLDILLLHRPDPLVEPEEVARAFSDLQQSGKVRYFGVSNHAGAQIALLQKFVDQSLIINQVEINLLHSHLINEGVTFNQHHANDCRTDGTLSYCRLHDILIQAWSPVAGGKLFKNEWEIENPAQKSAAALLQKMAEEKQTSREAIALGWLLRHPAQIQPIIGTTKPERIRASVLADDIQLTREEWYELFIAARGASMP